MTGLIFSREVDPIAWSEIRGYENDYGTKGCTTLVLPRPWTPQFALVSVSDVKSISTTNPLTTVLGKQNVCRIRELRGTTSHIIVRSSVVGESIWERGTYCSVDVDCSTGEFISNLDEAARQVISSVGGRNVAFLIQRYVHRTQRGEFGNLYRISKSRDHWEVNTLSDSGGRTLTRLNSQRDQAADPDQPLVVQTALARERLFGSIGAWLNNELLLGRRQRLNCEWVTDNHYYYIVQIDEEDEDVQGVNPFQIRTPYTDEPPGISGTYLQRADVEVIGAWDKLQVLNELWEPEAVHKPIFFTVRLSDLPNNVDSRGLAALEDDFGNLIGRSGIIVRTSVAAGKDKVVNLPRTEGLCPRAAATWCVSTAATLANDTNLGDLAFVAHRFVAARASAWVRADPKNPMVEIHALWGLPDALQFCPYDTWEIHVPTGVATDYTDYKSDMLIPKQNGEWDYVRVKNELARYNCISTGVAKELAMRSAAIAERLGRACHVMWFVGCTAASGKSFNLPWYWTEAHEALPNRDRTGHRIQIVGDEESLRSFVDRKVVKSKEALLLRPKDINLMRDSRFIAAVGRAAKDANVPVILSGSTLAHAYYILRTSGCTVITPSEKAHSRVRHKVRLGKLVRDRIPAMIDMRREINWTRRTSESVKKGFLVGKLIEEAMEVRNARTPQQKTEELGDLLEIVRSMAKAERIAVGEVEDATERKRQKVGGFDQGFVLLETGISPSDRVHGFDSDLGMGDVVAIRVAEDTVQIPFAFFGFIDFDRPRSIIFDDLGIWLQVTLRSDRIEIRMVRGPEQLGLPFDQ